MTVTRAGLQGDTREAATPASGSERSQGKQERPPDTALSHAAGRHRKDSVGGLNLHLVRTRRPLSGGPWLGSTGVARGEARPVAHERGPCQRTRGFPPPGEKPARCEVPFYKDLSRPTRSGGTSKHLPVLFSERLRGTGLLLEEPSVVVAALRRTGKRPRPNPLYRTPGP